MMQHCAELAQLVQIKLHVCASDVGHTSPNRIFS